MLSSTSLVISLVFLGQILVICVYWFSRYSGLSPIIGTCEECGSSRRCQDRGNKGTVYLILFTPVDMRSNMLNVSKTTRGIPHAPDRRSIVDATDMSNQARQLRVILIGGSSHAGKTSLGQVLASRIGWRHISTDNLARHPGRPWKDKPDKVPEHVAEHYLSLSTEELFADVLRHYKNLWLDIEAMITLHANDPSTDQLVMEGSALWPEFVAPMRLEKVAAIWLTASNHLFQSRIYNESNFEETAGRDQKMIQKFLERTHLYNQRMLEAVKQFGLVSIDIETTSSLEELANRCLQELGKSEAVK